MLYNLIMFVKNNNNQRVSARGLIAFSFSFIIGFFLTMDNRIFMSTYCLNKYNIDIAKQFTHSIATSCFGWEGVQGVVSVVADV